jgi:type II secretory pathway component GspD/PulD (secretin)
MCSRLAVLMVLTLFAATAVADGEDSSAASVSAQGPGIPVSTLIATVAKKTGKKFVLDPRVKADVVVIGQDASAVSYGDLLAMLRVYGYAAVDDGGYVRIIPDANVRTMSVPTISEKDSKPADEYVTALIAVKHVPAAQLVPILRPLLPQHAHLAAFTCTNTILIVDTYSNVRRLEGIIRAIDVGEPYKPVGCESRDGTPSK